MSPRHRAALGRPGRAGLLLPLAALAIGGAAAGATSAAFVSGSGEARAAGSTSAVTVKLRNIAFSPSSVRIRRGRRVTWVWADPYVPHNIHSTRRPRFAGASDKRTGRHTVRFTRTGTYRYACTLHPGMAGKVVVVR